MKKKTTRKIRRNKRATTQRRKNRSYKRMRGGWGLVDKKKKIVELLRNLLMNNYTEEDISNICDPQSLPTAENPLPTVKQSLLSPAGQPLKNATQLNKPLIRNYRALFELTESRAEYKYKFDKTDHETNLITNALKDADKQISYFDQLVKDERIVDILPPNDFETSLNSFTSSSSLFGGVSINDKLVYSMFALAVRSMTLLYVSKSKRGKTDVTATEVCPSIPSLADV